MHTTPTIARAPIAGVTLSESFKSDPLRVSALRAFSLTVFGADPGPGEWYLESTDFPDDFSGGEIPESSWNEVPESRIQAEAPWPLTWNVGNAYYRCVRLCLDKSPGTGSFTGVTAIFNSNDR